MKAINSWIKFLLIIWVVMSCTISAMLTFEPKDSDAYWWATEHHKGTIALEIVKSKASNDRVYGYDTSNFYIAYNAPMKPNSTVYSLVIYNPCNNYSDGILAVIDAGGIR